VGEFWRDEFRSLGLGPVAEAMLAEPPASTDAAPEPVLESELVYEAGLTLLEQEYRPRVRNVRQWAELNSAWADSVHEAAGRDLERIDRRRGAGFWREHPALAGLPGAA
jgi:hypothetical protein